MPPHDAGEPLTESQRSDLKRWIESGAAWPTSTDTVASDVAKLDTHWSFQAVGDPRPPSQGMDPIDAFLRLSWPPDSVDPPQATRRQRLRRASYALTGLPPSVEHVQELERDVSPDAWERSLDRLLASPEYGERMARLWFDVARYSDTKGYVYGREERSFVHASLYRSWVIQAFQEDLPYDRFLELQLAADQLVPEHSPDLAAMGFLTLGRRFLAVQPDIIDDRLDTVFRGLMGLTIGCARCHDHKFDPVSIEDYYALSGVFQSSMDARVQVATSERIGSEEFWQGLRERRQTLEELTATRRAEANATIIRRFADYLMAQTELDRYPDGAFNQILTKDELQAAIVRRWESALFQLALRDDSILRPWREFASLPKENFQSESPATLERLRREGTSHPLVLSRFSSPPSSLQEVADAYGQLAAELQLWEPSNPSSTNPSDDGIDRREVQQRLVGENSPFLIPDEPIDSTEFLWDNATCVELWAAQSEVDRWLLQPGAPAVETCILIDRPQPVEGRVLLRGDPNRKGRSIARRFPKHWSSEHESFAQGSGRLELARRIASKDNPLTARVWVNRVWQWHFGQGLVATPSDFGMRSEPPSHPELLDWLTRGFIEHGWSTAWLHREILRSEAFARSGDLRSADDSNDKEIDPWNRSLRRMPTRRLSWEELRDTWITVSGQLDRRRDGRSVDGLSRTAHGAYLRSVYSTIDRQYLPMTYQMFDVANPDLHTPVRSETIVPQQALFLLNHPLVADCARSLVQDIERGLTSAPADSAATSDEFAIALYRRVLQRDPNDAESRAAAEFLARSESERQEESATDSIPGLRPREQLAQVLMIGNEVAFLE
jgi:hypothetical protein